MGTTHAAASPSVCQVSCMGRSASKEKMPSRFKTRTFNTSLAKFDPGWNDVSWRSFHIPNLEPVPAHTVFGDINNFLQKHVSTRVLFIIVCIMSFKIRGQCIVYVYSLDFFFIWWWRLTYKFLLRGKDWAHFIKNNGSNTTLYMIKGVARIIKSWCSS